ncbi:MAG: hypothetical protein ACJAS3_000487, partial [Roseivirga sp.]
NVHSKVLRHENHPIPLDRNNMFEERLNYIHLNPVRAGMCFTPEDYVYASAGDYVGEIGLVSVELVCRGQSPLLMTSHRFGEPATVVLTIRSCSFKEVVNFHHCL